MATYEYMARNGAGEEVAGVIQGDSEAAVIRALDERLLFPVRVKAQEVRRRRVGRGRIRSRSVAAVYEGLSDLMRAGVPLLQSIETIARTMSNQRLCAVLLHQPNNSLAVGHRRRRGNELIAAGLR